MKSYAQTREVLKVKVFFLIKKRKLKKISGFKSWPFLEIFLEEFSLAACLGEVEEELLQTPNDAGAPLAGSSPRWIDDLHYDSIT